MEAQIVKLKKKCFSRTFGNPSGFLLFNQVTFPNKCNYVNASAPFLVQKTIFFVLPIVLPGLKERWKSYHLLQ